MGDDQPQIGDHGFLLVDRIERRLAGLLGEDIDEARRLDRDLGDLRIGDEDRRRGTFDAHQIAFVDFDGRPFPPAVGISSAAATGGREGGQG